MLQKHLTGVVFLTGDCVLLLYNRKREWVLPKGERPRNAVEEAFPIRLLQHRAGVEGRLLQPLGETEYERYNVVSKREVRNTVDWFLMAPQQGGSKPPAVPDAANGFVEAAYVPVEEALQRLTFPQEKNLLLRAYQVWTEQEWEDA